MASGPDHYREAERLIREARSISDGYGTAEYAQAIAEAQAHATLALAAAVGTGMASSSAASRDEYAWNEGVFRSFAEARAAR